jgi:hypothetical protein
VRQAAAPGAGTDAEDGASTVIWQVDHV